MTIRVSYRRADDGERWVGVLREGRTIVVECGHEHDNRDVTTSGSIGAQVCAGEILDGSRRPATADYVADRKRTAWQRINTGAGFVQPAGWLDKAKSACAESAADYLTRVAAVRAFRAARVRPARPETAEPVIGEMPDWML